MNRTKNFAAAAIAAFTMATSAPAMAQTRMQDTASYRPETEEVETGNLKHARVLRRDTAVTPDAPGRNGISEGAILLGVLGTVAAIFGAAAVWNMLHEDGRVGRWYRKQILHKKRVYNDFYRDCPRDIPDGSGRESLYRTAGHRIAAVLTKPEKSRAVKPKDNGQG